MSDSAGIDVLNHMWVGVFSAAYVQKCAEFDRRRGMDAHLANRVQIAKEAAEMADGALPAYRVMCEREAQESKAKR